MTNKKENFHLYYQGVLRTTLALVKYNKDNVSNEALRKAFEISLKESAVMLKEMFPDKKITPEVVTEAANLMIGKAEIIYEHYDMIGNNRLLQINTKQARNKFISQSSRIFRSVLKSINRESSQHEETVQILSEMHYQLKCRKIDITLAV